MWLFGWLGKRRGKFQYKVETTGQKCRLTFYGRLDTSEHPVVERALAEIGQLDWRELEVDCRHLRPYQSPVLGTHFAAVVIKLIRAAQIKAESQGGQAKWSFCLRSPEQIKFFNMIGKASVLKDHVTFGRGPFDWRHPIIVRSIPKTSIEPRLVDSA